MKFKNTQAHFKANEHNNFILNLLYKLLKNSKRYHYDETKEEWFKRVFSGFSKVTNKKKLRHGAGTGQIGTLSWRIKCLKNAIDSFDKRTHRWFHQEYDMIAIYLEESNLTIEDLAIQIATLRCKFDEHIKDRSEMFVSEVPV